MVSRTLIFAGVVAGVMSWGVAQAAPVSEVVLLDDLHIDGAQDGDVFVVGGDVYLSSHAQVNGHVVALFGEIHAERGAVVTGRALGVSSLATVTLLPSANSNPMLLRLGLRALTGGGWLLVTTLLCFALPRRVRYGVQMLPRIGFQTIIVGTLAYLTLFAALIAVLGLGPRLGVPCALLLMVAFLVCKAIGLAIIGGAVGCWLLEPRVRRHLPLTFMVFVGVGLALLIRFVPMLGGPFWTLLSVTALGTSILCLAVAPSTKAVEIPVPPGGPARNG